MRRWNNCTVGRTHNSVEFSIKGAAAASQLRLDLLSNVSGDLGCIGD
jgi:hypothetical protein